MEIIKFYTMKQCFEMQKADEYYLKILFSARMSF